MPGRKRNIYQHEINLRELKIINAPREEFRQELEQVPYLGYEVEQLEDGRKVVISKPGGKSVYGQRKRDDFFVFVYDPENNTLWQISHKQIREDIESKSKHNAQATKALISLLKNVHSGMEPDELLAALSESLFAPDDPGEPVDLLLKVYKWIWGQEDVNYPTGKGRDMSMEGIDEIARKLGME
ncbi:hypothetical protein J7K50_01795 [bacterium]|nr:hypothetical protein [bacterium]